MSYCPLLKKIRAVRDMVFGADPVFDLGAKMLKGRSANLEEGTCPISDISLTEGLKRRFFCLENWSAGVSRGYHFFLN